MTNPTDTKMSGDMSEKPMLHDWIKSTLGHGEVMCSRCCITNREAAVLGRLNECRPIRRALGTGEG